MFGISGALWGLLGLTFFIAATHSLAPDHWFGFVMLGRARKWGVPRTLGVAAIAGTGHVVTSIIISLLGVWAGATLAHNFASVANTVTGILLIIFGFAFALYAWLKGGHSHHGIPLINRLFKIDTKAAEELMHVHAHGDHDDHDEHDGCGCGHDDDDDDHDEHDHDKHEHGHDDHGEHDHNEHGHGHHDDDDDDDHDGHNHDDREHGRKKDTKAAYGLVAIISLTPCILLIPLALRAAEMSANAVVLTIIVFFVGTMAAILTLTTVCLKGLELIKMAFFEKYGEIITGVVLGLLGILVTAGLI